MTEIPLNITYDLRFPLIDGAHKALVYDLRQRQTLTEDEIQGLADQLEALYESRGFGDD